MRNYKYVWILGIIGTSLIILAPLVLLLPPQVQPDDPWDTVPQRLAHTDHSSLIQGTLETGSDVTRLCLSCHEDAASQVMQTTHWTWQAPPVEVEGRDQLVSTGKANVLNNFCIGIQSNWTGCTKCHAGYGWSDASFDFSNQDNVDCLVCHDQSGTYQKAASGNPAESVDLLVAARSVGTPTRENCGGCHFNGGGGNAVKHGDLDESLYFPPEDLDVHMGRLDFQCVDCHQTVDHLVAGRAMSVSVDTRENQVQCTDCHSETLHNDERIASHLDSLVCQTCHIPAGAAREATKMSWDWSTAGQDLPEDQHVYLKIKGSFVYEANFTPSYAWYNGVVDRYLLGDPLDPDGVTTLNLPLGDINDPTARIWPFKIHEAKQPYDAIYNYLLQPQTVGETGYWTTFDWDSALRNGSQVTGLPYSGSYGFADTTMYWNLSHMVVPAENALQCTDCHGDNSRMDWEALGYYGDPMVWGGR
jgi:octaheme c-type cytochrome (tetrathionate reductase family)